MPEELWRPSLDLALHRNRDHAGARLVQLATVRPDATPAIRTVVFRGFLDDARRLVFTTDGRSAKRAEIEANPVGAACWYFAATREQFRIRGELSLIDADTQEPELRQAREDQWSDLTDETRATFTWPTPGDPRDPSGSFPDEPPDPSAPLDCFCLIVLAATEVDHLELQHRPHVRWLYESDGRGRWSGREVNP